MIKEARSRMNPSSDESSPRPTFRPLHLVLIALVMTLLSLGLQWKNGTYREDIGADPDEPAHAVTSLMMRDYFAHGLLRGAHPMHFAQDYYDHFPKVALGHYPPGFYALAGAWLLPFPTKTALFLFMALLSGCLGAMTAAIARRAGLGVWASVLVGVWIVLLPLTQKQVMLVMSDVLLTIGCLGATWLWANYMERPTVRRGLLFGVVAAFSILVKGSAMALAAVPVLSILMLRRWDLLKKLSFWLAPVPVVLTALPWTLMTMQITKEGMLDQSVSSYLPQALEFYAKASWHSFGLVILMLSLLGLLKWIERIFNGECSPQPLEASMLGFALTLVALYLVSPTGFAARYLLPIAPILLVSAAKEWMHQISRPQAFTFHKRLGSGAVAMALLIACGYASQNERAEHKIASGFSTIADELLHRDAGGKVLVVSDAKGEGSLTAELAFRLPDRVNSPWTIVRGSKFLAKSDWIGRGYATAFTNADEFKAAAQKAGIAWVVDDTGVPEAYRLEHHQQMATWTQAWKADFEVESKKQWTTGSHPVRLYHLAPSTVSLRSERDPREAVALEFRLQPAGWRGVSGTHDALCPTLKRELQRYCEVRCDAEAVFRSVPGDPKTEVTDE